jgi:hypothetical protein
MALDATLSRWGIMTPRSCVSGMLSMVTVTLSGSWALVVLTSNHQAHQEVCVLLIHKAKSRDTRLDGIIYGCSSEDYKGGRCSIFVVEWRCAFLNGAGDEIVNIDSLVIVADKVASYIGCLVHTLIV